MIDIFCRPYRDLELHVQLYPRLKPWAILCRPYRD